MPSVPIAASAAVTRLQGLFHAAVERKRIHVGVDPGQPGGDHSCRVLVESKPDGTREVVRVEYGEPQDPWVPVIVERDYGNGLVGSAQVCGLDNGGWYFRKNGLGQKWHPRKAGQTLAELKAACDAAAEREAH